MSGVSFDRAAGYYDETRALPGAAAEAVSTILAAELSGAGTCLEIGIGTGRMALPLCSRGIPVLGTDISVPMLGRLRANAGELKLPVSVGDATCLPFRSDSVGAVLASHVMHLIPEWQKVLEEVLRVIRPGGVFLVDVGRLHRVGHPADPWREPVLRALSDSGISLARPGLAQVEDLVAALGDRATARPLEPVPLTTRGSLAKELDEWQHQIHSWTWQCSPDQIEAACNQVRRWAEEEGWPLDRAVERNRVIQWWAFDLA